MKTIRLLYPDHVSGGLDTYCFGADLLQHILPQNDAQPLFRVPVAPPEAKAERVVTDGIYAKDEVLAGIDGAQAILEAEKPDRVITIGGNCMVSLAPFDYLHGIYPDCGIVWIDAHPDVSTIADGYPNAHAMVLGSMLGGGDASLSGKMRNPRLKAEDVLYVGLQPIHDYQRRYLDDAGVKYTIQDKAFESDERIREFVMSRKHVLVHFDIDVLDERFFHSTYFANPELVGDGSHGGRMTMEKLGEVLRLIEDSAEVVGFTIAEYLPFDEQRLHKMLAGLKLFSETVGGGKTV